MCGIIGYIGKNVEKNLIEGLEKLEYRGYDSAGLCVKRDKEFYIEKTIGNVENLKNKINSTFCHSLGIAHTRWATHGEITTENAHPHFSADNEIAIVHNGIIENFESLKTQLEKEGVYFYGQTDSEIIAKLLKGRLSLSKIKKVVDKLKGSYALAIISKKNNAIYFAKNKSPLYVAIGEECSLIASDPSCFIGKTKNFYPVDDGEFGKLDLKKLTFCNKNGEIIVKKSQKLDINYKNENKNNFDHFMIKEINESEKVINNIIERYKNEEILQTLNNIKSMDFNRIYLIGCGTAYHAGLIGEKFLSQQIKVDIYCEKASEFQYQNHILNEKSLIIFISQSGETIDTISALEHVKKFNAKTLSITNVEYSTLAKISDYNLPICAGQEKAVASTKAYLGQCLVLYILSMYLSNKSYLPIIENFKNNIDYGNDDLIKNFAKTIALKDKVFFIGRGYDYVTAKEASLKLKEISYIYSCVEASGELKHGPLALIEKGTLIFVVATDEKLFNKTLNNAYETKSRGASLFLITSFNIDNKIKENFDYIHRVKKINQEMMPLQTIIFFQKLAYYVSVEREVNPDKPRNLAKSVTVE